MPSSNKPRNLWSRRTFLESSSLAAAALTLPARSATALASPSQSVTITAHPQVPGHAGPGLRLSTHRSTHWHTTTHTPTALAAHPTLPLLYTAFSGTDPASLVAYTVHRAPLALQLLSQQPVALAASHPCCLVVTPDGQSLLTLDHHGLFTLHPLLPDGHIGPVQHLRRLTGSRSRPGSLPRPTSLHLDPAGHIAFITDPACRRIVPVDLASPDGPAWLPEHPLSGIPAHPSTHTTISIAV